MNTVRRPLLAYAVALAALVAAVAVRWLLDPMLGDALPLVTLFGAVAAFGIAFGLLLLVFSKTIKGWMGGVEASAE